jgi:hypothetical protein
MPPMRVSMAAMHPRCLGPLRLSSACKRPALSGCRRDVESDLAKRGVQWVRLAIDATPYVAAHLGRLRAGFANQLI